jgi:hypothetical protein
MIPNFLKRFSCSFKVGLIKVAVQRGCEQAWPMGALRALLARLPHGTRGSWLRSLPSRARNKHWESFNISRTVVVVHPPRWGLKRLRPVNKLKVINISSVSLIQGLDF